MARKVSFSETDARRIASTVRAYERGNRDQAGVFFRQVGDDAAIVRGTFSGSWAKGATATVTDALANTVTYTAKNYWASVNCPTATTCFLAYVSGEWVLQSLDLTGLSGYSGSTQQVLTHDTTGVIAWVSTTACQ